MYSEEHRNLQNLGKFVEQRTGKKTKVYSLTRSNGNRLYEVILGADNPAFSPVIRMEESFANYQRDWLERVLYGTMAVYERFRKLVEIDCDYQQMKNHLHLRLMNYEKNRHFLENSPYDRFLDLAVVPVLALREDAGEMAFSIMRNIQRGEWKGSIGELLQAAYENGENDCMIEVMEFSAEELGFEAYLMSNGFHCATIDKRALRKLAVETFSEHLYLVPANVYEVLAIPEDNVFEISELRELTERLHESLEREEAFLSKNIYRFSKGRNIIEIM